MFQHKNDLIGIFAQHKLGANLMMLVMLLSGGWSLHKLNTQFFPDYALDFITVAVVWSGASAEDIEKGITEPLEEELRSLDNVKKMTSTSKQGSSLIVLEYHEGTRMSDAQDQVKEKVALVRNLPANSETPEINLVVQYEPVARLLLSGASLEELRPLAYALERDLLDHGIAKVEIEGLPELEIAVQVDNATQRDLGLSLIDIADQINRHSRDIPAGTIGREDISMQLRSLEQRRDASGFSELGIVATNSGQQLRLGDIATIEKRARDRQIRLKVDGQDAVELHLMRTKGGDSLGSAEILEEWVSRQLLPEGIALQVYDETWQLIRDRIFLLLKNGGGGLILVMLILFLFLNGRVAFWVAVGIPISFMATLSVIYLIGGSINMISLFAMIMALGIIVDDAIVVGEDALAHYQSGEAELEASEGGARRMLSPVLASSLTTIAAFLPLIMVSGIIGNILFDIPMVVSCVILASLIECFLILPGHLKHAFAHMHSNEIHPRRKRLDQAFNNFREYRFRPLVTLAVDHRMTTLSMALGLLVLCAGLVAGGRIPFSFFPTTESNVLTANVSFVAGTPRHQMEAFIDEVEQALYQAETSLGADLIVAVSARYGTLVQSDDRPPNTGDEYGSLMVEIIPSDQRDIRNETFLQAWEERLAIPASIEHIAITSRKAGHPGRAVNVELSGGSAEQLKQAVLDVSSALRSVKGVSAIEDDMPWGQSQFIYHLTDRARGLGLSIEDVGRQLRAMFDGRIAQVFHDGNDEIEVRVVLPDHERNRLQYLDDVMLNIGRGHVAPLSSIVSLQAQRGFEVLQHTGGHLSAHVFADVDSSQTNENIVREQLAKGVLKDLHQRWGIEASFEGKAADQAETISDMKWGALIAFALIYLILAWVFASWGWPLVIMATIPFAIIGALLGHWFMGIDLTILSLFGVFGLSGIVVNDSIILMSFYRRLRNKGYSVRDGIIEAACQRLRAVLLTSLTTIAGLLPLLFETSLQAQFLIPMATSISFGLGFATLLVLFVIPSLLSVHESVADRLFRRQTALENA